MFLAATLTLRHVWEELSGTTASGVKACSASRNHKRPGLRFGKRAICGITFAVIHNCSLRLACPLVSFSKAKPLSIGSRLSIDAAYD